MQWQICSISIICKTTHSRTTESRNQYMHACSKELETKIGWGSYLNWHNPSSTGSNTQ